MFLIVEEFRKIILSINFFLKCKCKIFNSSDKAPFQKEEKGKGKENEKWGKKKKNKREREAKGRFFQYYATLKQH